MIYIITLAVSLIIVIVLLYKVHKTLNSEYLRKDKKTDVNPQLFQILKDIEIMFRPGEYIYTEKKKEGYKILYFYYFLWACFAFILFQISLQVR